MLSLLCMKVSYRLSSDIVSELVQLWAFLFLLFCNLIRFIPATVSYFVPRSLPAVLFLNSELTSSTCLLRRFSEIFLSFRKKPVCVLSRPQQHSEIFAISRQAPDTIENQQLNGAIPDHSEIFPVFRKSSCLSMIAISR